MKEARQTPGLLTSECCYPALASALFLDLYRFFIPPAVFSLYFPAPGPFRRAARPVAPASSPVTVRQSQPGPDSIFRCRWAILKCLLSSNGAVLAALSLLVLALRLHLCQVRDQVVGELSVPGLEAFC